jgi:hypothetical protein
MATKKSSPAMQFVVAALKKNPKADYAEVRETATRKGLTIYPIMYGRAKALLGLVPISPRGSKKKKKKGRSKATAAEPAGAVRPGPKRKNVGRRSPGSTRKDTDPLQTLETMITAMKDTTRDRDRYQRALEKIGKILETEL